MQESRQSQPRNPSDVSDLMDDWVRVCDTCGDVGKEDSIALCNKCTDGAQHIYCMRVMLKEVPKGDWTCEDCTLRAGTHKLMQYKVEEAARRKGRLQSSKGSKLKFRSSYAGRSGKNGLSSTSSLSAKRHGVPLEAHSEKKARDIESQLAEHPTKAATAMSLNKLCTGPASDERSHLRGLAQVEAATLLQGGVIPEFDYAWLGKFQIHNNEGTARTCDGLQAHLSTCASPKVLEVVYRLPEIIILEELPRLRMWPSQFMGRQVTEENIGLYFFAKDVDSYYTYYRGLMNYMIKNDLALKGNLDGVELLIFSSNILPEEIQRWNQMLFFWGVFKGRKVNNSANSPPVSNSLKPENRDTVKIRAFDLNAYPEDEDEEAGVDEIPQFDNMGGTGDGILLVGDSSNGKGGEAKPECAVVDVNLPLQTRSATPENGAVGIEDTSTSVSLAQPSTAIHLDQLDWQLAETLIILSRDRF